MNIGFIFFIPIFILMLKIKRKNTFYFSNLLFLYYFCYSVQFDRNCIFNDGIFCGGIYFW